MDYTMRPERTVWALFAPFDGGTMGLRIERD